jgi:hypothetical protein
MYLSVTGAVADGRRGLEAGLAGWRRRRGGTPCCAHGQMARLDTSVGEGRERHGLLEPGQGWCCMRRAGGCESRARIRAGKRTQAS